VPAVSPQLSRCVVFLYKTVEDAHAGKLEGASGFLAHVPWEDGSGRSHIYVVTNKHNVQRGGLAVRVSKRGPDRGITALMTRRERWMEHPGCDLAVYHIADPPSEWESTSLGVDMFLTFERMFDGLRVLPGDDVVLLSRFVSQEGTQHNTPAVHTGVISMLPWNPVENPETGQKEESFLVETHSHGGYSGSPVIGYMHPNAMTLGVDRSNFQPPEGFVYLLGMLWGHINLKERVKNKKGEFTGDHVSIRSGLAGVVPAWQIVRLLETSDAIDVRKGAERMVNEEQAVPEPEVVVDFQETESDSPTRDLLGKLMKVPKVEADEVHRSHDQS